jgi:hypothetical protein
MHDAFVAVCARRALTQPGHRARLLRASCIHSPPHAPPICCTRRLARRAAVGPCSWPCSPSLHPLSSIVSSTSPTWFSAIALSHPVSAVPFFLISFMLRFRFLSPLCSLSPPR